jgi:hypothetical protein
MNCSEPYLDVLGTLDGLKGDLVSVILFYLNVSNQAYIELISLFFSLIAGLAGATADVHCYDVLSNKWTRYSFFLLQFGASVLCVSSFCKFYISHGLFRLKFIVV